MDWWRRRDPVAPVSPADTFDELLSAYADGEVTDAERRQVEAAITTDATARERLDDLRAVRDVFAALGPVRAPRSFAIVAPAAPARASMRGFEWATRVGAAVSALLFAIVLVQGGGSSETPVRGLASTAATEATASPQPDTSKLSTGATPSPAAPQIPPTASPTPAATTAVPPAPVAAPAQASSTPTAPAPRSAPLAVPP